MSGVARPGVRRMKRYGLRPVLFTRRGYTLIELLIVLSILTILSGLLFPAFAAVRERARQAACLTDERQLGLALLQYSQDYDEGLPSGTIGTVGQGWAGQIYPFVKHVALY